MENIQAGQTIGPYQIIQQIGQGGMATVYKAYQPAMDRYVALKILPRQLAESPEFMGRFRQEARTIARLEHAHILPVHDYGESGSYTYLAMRFVEAGTLKDRLQAGPLRPDEIDKYFRQLADALDYAHAHGVVHRDLKPSNVLLDARGDLFLTDFGIAKLLETDSRFTGTGALIGTPAYMSPEQAQGLPIDRRTDIYSLGIMLYEMVTDRLPFEADTPLAIILKQISSPLPLPSSMKPGVTPAIEQLLLKALAKNPADRFATAAEFSAAWQAAPKPGATQMSAPTAAAQPPVSAAKPTAAAALPNPAPAVAGAAVPPAPPASVARPGRSRGLPLLAGGVVLAIGLVVCLSVVLVLALNNQRLLNAARATGTPRGAATGSATGVAASATGTALATLAPGVAAPALASGAAHWQSFAAANNLYVVTLFNDQLASGGPGGVTLWKLPEGTVASRLTTANGLPDPNVQALFADDETHSLWIGTYDGLVAYDGQQARLYDTSTGLDSNNVTVVARTKAGLLSGSQNSGVDGGGLNLFDNGRWQPVDGFPSAANTDSEPDKLSTSVSGIVEDAQGNWWVGTRNGLGFYNGQAWQRYSTDNGLPDNDITALLETTGTLWVGTNSGLAQWDGSTFTVVPETEDKAIEGMFAGQQGRLWLTGNSAIVNRALAGGPWQTYDSSNFPASNVAGGLQAGDGTLYLASDAGVLRFDGRTFDLWAVPDVPPHVNYNIFIPGPDNNLLWLLEYNGANTDVLDLAQKSWSRLANLACEACFPYVRAADGRVWAGSSDGMWIVQGNQATHVTRDNGMPGGARTIVLDADGSAWLGTDAGVAHYEGSAVTGVFSTTNGALTNNTVNALLTATDGSLWVATESGVSQRTPDGKWVLYGQANPFQGNVQVYGLAQDTAGSIWVGTYGEGAYRFAGGSWTQFRPGIGGVKLPSDMIYSVTSMRDGSVWFGTDGAGAARFDGVNWQAITVADGLINPTVNDIYEDPSGRVWFATDGGVTLYQP